MGYGSERNETIVRRRGMSETEAGFGPRYSSDGGARTSVRGIGGAEGGA